MSSAWRRTVALGVALATLAALPMLFAPWDEDEVFLVGAVAGTSPWMNTRFDAYRFSSGDPAEVAALVAKGVFPWYIAPDFKYALFRPLTSFVLWLDATLFGASRIGYQLDAFVWHAALIVAAGLLFRRALPDRVGRWALLLFSVSVVHTTVTGWLTARHVLVGTVPVLFGLEMHQRWREEGLRAGLPLSVALFAAGLLGSEAGVQALGYVGAYEVTRREVSWRRRVVGLLPVALVVTAYAAMYWALDRGHAYGSPLGSVQALVTRGLPRVLAHAAVLLGVSLRPNNAWGYDALRPTMIVALPIVLLAPFALRRLGEQERRGATWLALGAVLALLPVMGAPLESRVLVASSLGSAAVVAILLAWGIECARRQDVRGLTRLAVVAGALAIAVVHAILAVIELPQHYLAMSRARERRFGAFVRSAGRFAPPDVDVFVVGAPHFLYGQLGGYLRQRALGAHRVGAPNRWIPVADANCAHRVARTGVDRIEIQPRCREGFFPYGRLEAGDEVAQRDWIVRVVEGHPRARFEIVFPRPIEELPVAFVTFGGFVDRRVDLPVVGASLVLPEPAPASLEGIDPATQWFHAHFGD